MPASHTLKKIVILAMIAVLIAAPLVSFAQEKKEDGKNTESCGTFNVFCYMTKFFNYMTIQVGTMIASFAAFLISLGIAIIQIIVAAGAKVIENPFVTTGFKITLDVANLGFVLAIIVVAFTTMFRVSGYETKKLLRNLILAALLVNFSLTIAGLIIDASNVFGNFFINAAGSGGDPTKPIDDYAKFKQFGENLANSLNIQKLLNIVPDTNDSNVGSVLKFGASYLNIFISLATTVIASAALVVTVFAIAVMLVIRYLYIVMLLVLMPLAWLAWIFPGYSHLFSKWWQKFLHWNTFYPAVALFLYIGIESSQRIGDVVKASAGKSVIFNGGTNLAGLAGDTMVGFIQIFLQVGVMFGGLLVANSLGMEAGKAGLDIFKGLKTSIIGKGVNWQKIGQKVGEKSVGVIARTPVIGTMASPLLSTVSPTFRKERGAFKEASTDKSGAQIAEKVKSGEMDLNEVRRRAGSSWRSAVPILRKQRANNIAALAALESGGKYQVGKEGAQLGIGVWQNPEANDKEKRLIEQRRAGKTKKEKEKQGPSLEDRLKKIEEKEEEDKK